MFASVCVHGERLEAGMLQGAFHFIPNLIVIFSRNQFTGIYIYISASCCQIVLNVIYTTQQIVRLQIHGEEVYFFHCAQRRR